ncbi:unnamed protein product [Caenorhabditis brenneri]
MKLSPIFVFLLFAVPIVTLYSTVPLGPGYVENPAFQEKHCGSLDITLDFEGDEVYKKKFQEKCTSADRFGSGRAKRVEPFTVGVVLVGVVYLAFHAVQFGLHMSLQNQVAENSNALNSTLAANAILEEQLRNLTADRKKKEFDEMLAAGFQSSDIEKAISTFGLDVLPVLENLGFDMRMGTDELRNMEFSLVCGKNDSHFRMEICGWKNPTRQYGTVKMVSPIGEFGHQGNSYSHYDTPTTAVFTENGTIVSVDRCRKFGAHYGCEETVGNCTLENYKQCPISFNLTPDGVFATELGDATAVATTENHYSFYENNSTTSHTIHNVPNSGQFLLRAPHNSFIEIGSRRFYGRHDQLEITPIKVMRQIAHLDREKMDAWEKAQTEAGRSIDRAAFERARGTTDNFIQAIFSNMPSWPWYYHLLAIIVLILIFVVAAFVGVGFYICCCAPSVAVVKASAPLSNV